MHCQYKIILHCHLINIKNNKYFITKTYPQSLNFTTRIISLCHFSLISVYVKFPFFLILTYIIENSQICPITIIPEQTSLSQYFTYVQKSVSSAAALSTHLELPLIWLIQFKMMWTGGEVVGFGRMDKTSFCQGVIHCL